MSKSVILHICCSVCALASIQTLKEDGCEVEGLFFNPNIHPGEEYEKRKNETEKLEKIASIKIHYGDYESEKWFDLCKIYKDEHEGGIRCSLCYEMRLNETMRFCREKKFDFFTTTLTISPHKKSQIIMEIGRRVGGNLFLPMDFKKKDGFKKTIEMAKNYNFYRQNYCGCVFSRKK